MADGLPDVQKVDVPGVLMLLLEMVLPAVMVMVHTLLSSEQEELFTTLRKRVVVKTVPGSYDEDVAPSMSAQLVLSMLICHWYV